MTDQHMQMYAPTDVIDLARRVDKAFPHIPLLGPYILIEEKTGRLFVLATSRPKDADALSS